MIQSCQWVVATISLVLFAVFRDSDSDFHAKMEITDTGLFSVEVTLKVALLPAETALPMEAVRNQLNDLLFKYNDDIDGIPLTYSDLKFPSGKECGRIIAEMPMVHIDVLTKALVFKPSQGLLLEGTINKVTDSHMSLLVHGMFNASLSRTEIKKRYSHFEGEKWITTSGESVGHGDMIFFRVARCQQFDGMLNIIGKFDG